MINPLLAGPRVQIETVVEICVAATAHHPWPAVEQALRDDLDGSVLVCLSSWPRAREALAALTRHGLAAGHSPSGVDGEAAARIRVTGWDPRLLRRRLAVLLAGVDDLGAEWEATAEVAMYCYDRRAAAATAAGTEDPDLDWRVSAEVEATLRRSDPLPHTAPAVRDIAHLHDLIDSATDRYEQLIAEHVSLAERVVTRYRAELAVADHDRAGAATLAAVPALRHTET